jgi:DNA repair exonuclease SbcCD nuclease subunit
MNEIRLIHLADIHLGFTGPTNLTVNATENAKAAGRYLREVDIETAFNNMRKAIITAQPEVDIVLIAGDLFHKPAPYPPAISMAARMVRSLVKHGIVVVIIDGNHETGSMVHTGSPTTFLRELGAHVVNGATYELVQEKWHDTSAERQMKLNQLAIHALPYRAVMEKQFESVHPLVGYINVLLAHGHVSGIDEYNSLYRTAPVIPTTLLHRGWDYVALGHWHTHRCQPQPDVPAFYSGSLEALNFGEAAFHSTATDVPYRLRGALDVRLGLGKPAVIHTYPNKNARPVLRLKEIDATDIDANILMNMLRNRLGAAFPAESLIILNVRNCLSATYDQLDHREIAALRKRARRCEIRWDIKRPQLEQKRNVMSEMAIENQWQHFIEQQEHKTHQCSWYYEKGLKRIEDARTETLAGHAHRGE